MYHMYNEAAETMPREQLRELQSQRLVDTVKRVYEKLEKLAAGENVFGAYPYLGLRSADPADCV